jgi:hypothetical protein
LIYILLGYILYWDANSNIPLWPSPSSTATKEETMPTIFVRERRKIEAGEKKPRYRVVGVHDLNLKIYVEHIRKRELDQLAEVTGANVVILKGGKEEKEKGKQEAQSEDKAG